jgi:TonB-linked SusC/RagA family outer membrane protein
MDKFLQIFKKLSLALSLVLLWQFNVLAQHEVTGTVTDEISDETLPGVNILVQGTNRGASTDADGQYSLTVPSSADSLVFSYVGYQTQVVAIQGRSEIDVVMTPTAEFLDEVVVVGYGEQTKESVIGAISSVSGTDLQSAQVGSNLTTSLQGAASGLTVFTTDAAPGETQTVMQIRAATSMGNNSPLLVVDGVEKDNIGDIDPIEVESVSVLKGASATAVYGVKAANGVVIIKTKRGRAGDLNLNFSTETTVKQPTRTPDFASAYETLKLRNEAFRNDQQWDRIVSDEVLEHYRKQDMPYIYPSFDWQDFYWEPAMDQKYNLNASGGSDFMRFFTSVSYLREGDIMNTGPAEVFPYEMDHNYWSNRYNFRNNLDFYITDDTQISLQVGGNIQDWNRPRDYFTQEMMFEPVTSLPFYPAEALEKYPDNRNPYRQSGVRPFNDPSQGETRMAWIGGSGVLNRKSNDFNANVVLDQNLEFITQGLQVTGQYSYQSSQQYQAEHFLSNFFGYHLQPDGTWMRYDRWGEVNPNDPQPELNIQDVKSLQASEKNFYYNVQLDYKNNFGDHNVAATGVFSRRKATEPIFNFPSYEENWVGRTTYNYQSKYFLEGSISHAGSEKFAPGKRFGTFPSFGAGWMVSNENFFRDAASWFNHLKLKFSWGKIGSDAGIARWLYQSEYDPGGGNVVFGNPRQSYSVIDEGNVPVPDATWEEATKINIGVETGFLDNQITLNVDLYEEFREDILQTRNSIPTWMGVSGVSANVGETKAHGIEVELGLNTNLSNRLNLFMDFKGSLYETRVVDWDQPESVPFHLNQEGKPVGIASRMNFFTPATGVEVMGYYQNFDELFMWPLAGGSPMVGDQKFLDFNGDGQIDENDRIVAKYPYTPTYNWNANLGFNYRNWTVQATFYGIANNNFQARQGGMWYLYPFAQGKNNSLTVHQDRWTPDNRDPSFPTPHAHAEGHYNHRSSSFSSLNGQYIRLKRALISYRLQSEGLTSSLGIDQIQFSLTGSNLWTWTKLPYGGDPEGGNYAGQDFGAYPIQRTYSLKTQIQF